ncbi:hypothetical protein N7495_006563 [Penicillium taxi]|uniref:uncharacterized protein n=1 Tax=Penicillium taxi TaxID=168475 RepID=UPI00254502FF|nr:uncharacterized protein N7495_006563 [Penicillium taxi]KAJ5894872.1 hypothetical protein N7495_006563 [Penicillium taxi]
MSSDDIAVNPSSLFLGRPALGVCWALATITLIITIARLYTQARITHQLGLSDALLVLSTFHYGWGRHQITLSGYDQMMALKYNSIGQSCGVMGSTCGRLSTIVLMMNLFAINPKVRRLMWGIFAAQIITNGVTVICLYAQCTNVVLLWDKTGNVPGTCWNGDVQTVRRIKALP